MTRRDMHDDVTRRATGNLLVLPRWTIYLIAALEHLDQCMRTWTGLAVVGAGVGTGLKVAYRAGYSFWAGLGGGLLVVAVVSLLSALYHSARFLTRLAAENPASYSAWLAVTCHDSLHGRLLLKMFGRKIRRKEQ